MKVLTIKQPWASLIMQGIKKYEFRSWQTKYRGDILIHSASQVDKEAMEKYSKYLTSVPTGVILGIVTITDCIKKSEDFKQILLNEKCDVYTEKSFEANYGWKIENIRKFKNLIKAKGKLGLWNYEIEGETIWKKY